MKLEGYSGTMCNKHVHSTMTRSSRFHCPIGELFTYCCLVLPITCIALVLRQRHATGGARVLIWTCWGLRQRLVATWAEFQHSVMYYATEQCRKRLEACINAEGGHSEHLLWRCLPDIPVATHHNRFFSEPPTTTHNWLFSEPATSKRRQQTFNQMKCFAIHKLVWWYFQVG